MSLSAVDVRTGLGRCRLPVWGLAWALLAACPVRGAAAGELEQPAATGTPVVALDAQALAQQIDLHLTRVWEAAGIVPAPAADDGELMRRLYLHIVGKIPTAAEAREFLDSTAADKRAQLVDELLSRAAFATHMASVWRELLLPGANNNPETVGLIPPLETWLRLRLADETPYDRLAFELLTARLQAPVAMQPLRTPASRASPVSFYQYNEYKPENLAANAARVFLGVQVQCAQCHDHPFARWKRTQFWSLAAFFTSEEVATAAGGMAQGSTPAGGVPGRSVRIPDLEPETVVAAAFLDGSVPDWTVEPDSRVALAKWMVRLDNPYFARACANRMWEHFFGRGLIEPVDDLDAAAGAPLAPLLDLLAQQFAYHRYDLKYLVRAIVATQAYQRSSRAAADDPDALALFARMPVQHLTADQLFDSLLAATGYRERRARNQPFNPFDQDTPRAVFRARFGNQTARRTEPQTSILQALALMNGGFVSEAANLKSGELLGAVADAPYLDTAGRVETLFLATLSRRPQPEELAEFCRYVEQSGDPRQALADVLWALLNCAEFALNH
jgi:hypothetical protein